MKNIYLTFQLYWLMVLNAVSLVVIPLHISLFLQFNKLIAVTPAKCCPCSVGGACVVGPTRTLVTPVHPSHLVVVTVHGVLQDTTQAACSFSLYLLVVHSPFSAQSAHDT